MVAFKTQRNLLMVDNEARLETGWVSVIQYLRALKLKRFGSHVEQSGDSSPRMSIFDALETVKDQTMTFTYGKQQECNITAIDRDHGEFLICFNVKLAEVASIAFKDEKLVEDPVIMSEISCQTDKAL